MEKIDYVILWVDGADKKWLEEKNRYSPQKVGYGSDVNRFRSFDNLQYWFRGVEKFAPWVNKIFFITWGHLPEWLDVSNPKLRIINHRDYIPAEYLPTFNSNTIELNLFRIEELSEHFVLFNDDMFIIDHMKPEDFFKNGLPRDAFLERSLQPTDKTRMILHTNLNNLCIINEHFSKKKVIRDHPFKLLSPQYGLKDTLGNLFMLRYRRCFCGIKDQHIPLSHLKSTFNTVWKEESEWLDNSCRNRFRSKSDLSHWLFRYWNLCSGRFEPRSPKVGKAVNISDDNRKTADYIIKQQGKMICVNDVIMMNAKKQIDFSRAMSEINAAFEMILPEKCSFEK